MRAPDWEDVTEKFDEQFDVDVHAQRSVPHHFVVLVHIGSDAVFEVVGAIPRAQLNSQLVLLGLLGPLGQLDCRDRWLAFEFHS